MDKLGVLEAGPKEIKDICFFLGAIYAKISDCRNLSDGGGVRGFSHDVFLSKGSFQFLHCLANLLDSIGPRSKMCPSKSVHRN